MKIIRTWPARVPDGRCYVQDNLPRLVCDRYDFRGLGEFGDDVLLLEWDMAVGRDELEGFARRAAATPERVLVAPYVLYGGVAGRARTVWAHRYWSERRHQTGEGHVPDGAPWCHLFAFGMTYLPREVIDGYLMAQPGQPLNDRWLPEWHYQNVRHRVPIDWSVRPVHLHYDAGPLLSSVRDLAVAGSAQQ